MIDGVQGRRVALAHDWLVGLRGGERVLDRLAVQFGPTDLYVLVNDGRPLTAAIDACRVVTSPLQRFPGAAGAWRRHYLPLHSQRRYKIRRQCDRGLLQRLHRCPIVPRCQRKWCVGSTGCHSQDRPH